MHHSRRARVLFPVACTAFAGFALSAAGAPNFTRNILITGYWPPTNNIVRQFSTSSTQNPEGWRGKDWEGRGFSIHSHFPEFPGLSGPNWGKGVGDFEVDYQDTAEDFEKIVNELKPAAIITLSRANTSKGWELEPAARRHRLPGEPQHPRFNVATYSPDYTGNLYPTDVPIAREEIGNARLSTLPMQDIVDAVNGVFPPTQLQGFIPAYDPQNPNSYDFGGAFLSGYIAYLGQWYHDLNAGPTAAARNFCAGHIHVGTNVDLDTGTRAVEITLREVIEYINGQLLPAPGTTTLAACGLMMLARRRR